MTFNARLRILRERKAMMMKYFSSLVILAMLLPQSNGAGGFFWGNSDINNKKAIESASSSSERKYADSKAPSGYSVRDNVVDRKSTIGLGSKLMPSITDVDDSHLYISEDDLASAARGRSGGSFSGSSFDKNSKKIGGEPGANMKSKNQRRRDIDADEDYNYNSERKGSDESKYMRGYFNGNSNSNKNNDNNRKSRTEYDPNSLLYDNGEIGIDLNHLEGGMKSFLKWTKNLPKVNLQLDPVINFKLKQKISHFGACITLGMDYLSELAQWRAYCAVEDTIVGGRFSLRGSELGWTKSWFMNLGLGEESTAKIKLRMGLNLKSYKAYARVRFRTEPLSTFDIGEGLSCAGKIPLPGLLPILRSIPLRVEYRLRINTPQPDVQIRKGKKNGTISISTGIDRVDLSLDELNFCLEWDERSPVWGIGLVRSGPTRKALGSLFGEGRPKGQQGAVKGVGARAQNKQMPIPYPA